MYTSFCSVPGADTDPEGGQMKTLAVYGSKFIAFVETAVEGDKAR